MSNREKRHELAGTVFDLQDLIDHQTGAIVSRTLVVDGTARVTVEGDEFEIEDGTSVVLPADEPHAVGAVSPFEMLLTMVR
jgi:quercetin dioxygenase-like cupin family protein